MSTHNNNYLEVQRAFDSLMAELEGIRDLNSVADSHRRNAEELMARLQEHYSHSRDGFALMMSRLEEEREALKKTTEAMTLEMGRRLEGLEKIESEFEFEMKNVERRLMSAQRRQTTLVGVLSSIAICLLIVVIVMLCR